MHATQHVCAAVAIELWDVVAPHGLVCAGALSDTAIAVVLVSTIPLRMTCATLHRHLWPCRNNQRVAQQPHCPQRSPRLLRAFHELSEPAVHVAMLVALFERMLRCCINILIISYILHLYLQLIRESSCCVCTVEASPRLPLTSCQDNLVNMSVKLRSRSPYGYANAISH